MRLYLFEHCSVCFRVRMTAALKHLHLQETVLLDDDSETMIGLAGKRIVPILVKDDGRPMLGAWIWWATSTISAPRFSPDHNAER
jgi:glutaredoxin 2